MQITAFSLTRLLVLALLAVAASTMAKAATPPAPDQAGLRLAASATHLATTSTLRIVAFGSSSTWGSGATTRAAAYPAQLESQLRSLLPGRMITVVNAGVGGEDAEDFARRVDAVLAEKPDLVILQTGTNDPLRKLPVDRFAALTRDEIKRLRDGGADVMLMEPQLCRVFDAAPGALAYRDALRAIGAEMGVPVIRRYDMMREWLARGTLTADQMQSSDGLHMTDGGYRLLAEAIARDIVRRIGAPHIVATR